MARKKRGQRKIWMVIVILLLAAAATGYAASRGALGLGACNLMQTIFHLAEPAPPPENLPKDPADRDIDPADPTPENPGDPDPPGQSPEDPQPDKDPTEQPGSRPPDPPAGDSIPPAATPVIFVGQSLVIPVPGEAVGNSASQIIGKGTLSPGTKQVALTFDSGWLFDQTISLLDTLDQYGVTATFFPRALWVKEHPDLAWEIASRGHTIGNHSLTHPHMKGLNADQIRQEMRESTEIIQSTTGVRPYLFRPPFGEYNQLMLDILGQEGYPYSIMWTVDTHDWADELNGKTITVDYVVNRVLDNVEPNAIMLMHVGGPKTVQALPRIITGLRDKGYTFNTVDKMLPAPNFSRTVHMVVKGETLYSISKKYGVSVQQIIDANGLNS